MRIAGPTLDDPDRCETVLRSLPDWFGIEVKTIAATRQHAGYVQTRAFYEGLGFDSLEVFPGLWSPVNPCLQMIKRLG